MIKWNKGPFIFMHEMLFFCFSFAMYGFSSNKAQGVKMAIIGELPIERVLKPSAKYK